MNKPRIDVGIKPRTVTARRRRNFDRGWAANTHRVSDRAHERLRMLCLLKGIPLQQLYDEALDLWLTKEAEPPLEPLPPMTKKAS